MKGYRINPDEKRTKYTPNQIRVDKEKGVAEIDVYDSFGKYRATGYFSLIDLETIKPYKWYLDSTGYLRTTLPNGTKMRMHNLITGEKGIDHKDRNKLNNTRKNLRKCEKWQNGANCIQYNSGEIVGVRKNKNNTYEAYIEHKKRKKRKKFKTKEEAIVQRLIWDINIFGEFSPQLEKVEEKYPLMLLGLYVYPLKDSRENVHKIINFYTGKSCDYDFWERGNNDVK